MDIIKNHIFWVLPQHKPTNKGKRNLLPHHNKQTTKVRNFVFTSGPIQKHIKYKLVFLPQRKRTNIFVFTSARLLASSLGPPLLFLSSFDIFLRWVTLDFGFASFRFQRRRRSLMCKLGLSKVTWLATRCSLIVARIS